VNNFSPPPSEQHQGGGEETRNNTIPEVERSKMFLDRQRCRDFADRPWVNQGYGTRCGTREFVDASPLQEKRSVVDGHRLLMLPPPQLVETPSAAVGGVKCFVIHLARFVKDNNVTWSTRLQLQYQTLALVQSFPQKRFTLEQTPG